MKKNVSTLNVLHIVPKLSTSGGIGNQLLKVLRTYDRNEFMPFVCSLREKGEIGNEIENLGIDVESLNIDFKRGIYWTVIKKLYRLIKEKNIHVVRTHEYRANLHGRIAALIARVPCIIASVHNIYESEYSDYKREQKINRRILNRYLAALTDRVVAVSTTVKSDILKFDGIPEAKVDVIYNGIYVDEFVKAYSESVRSELGISPDRQIIGSIGRLVQQKGQKYLIEAIAQIKAKHPDVLLLVIGDGPLENELKEYTKDLGIEDNVIFLGIRRDIPSLLSAMNIFVFPSLWEGLGNALIEAMAAGKPIIATGIPVVKEIFDSCNGGIIVPPENSEALAFSFESIFNDKNLSQKLGTAARERALSCYDIKTSVNKYTTLYKKILAGKGIILNSK